MMSSSDFINQFFQSESNFFRRDAIIHIDNPRLPVHYLTNLLSIQIAVVANNTTPNASNLSRSNKYTCVIIDQVQRNQALSHLSSSTKKLNYSLWQLILVH